MRGRTEPDDEGWADDEAPLLLAGDEADVLPDGLAAVAGLLPDDGFPPVEGLALGDGLPLDAGLAPDEGFAVVDGELADGVEDLGAGGGVACATGAPPPEERL